MRRPDFFIVGAPKCGTTALNIYLREHPQVFMSPRKEAHHFGTDIYSPRWARGEAEYLALFAGARAEKRVGEASVWQLFSQRAAREIKAFEPHAQIIIMLRNPTEMIYSLHSERLYSVSEDITDFAAALAAEPDRRRGLRLPAYPYPVEGLIYRDVGKYTAQVARFFNEFGRERVRVIIYDDFKRDAAAEFRATCEFLDVDAGFRPETKVINSNKRIRSRRVLSWIDSPPPFIRRLGAPLTPRNARHWVLRKIRRANTSYEPRAPMSEGLRRELQAEFAPEVERLSELLGRDLTHWSRS